jgi:hypothetical protein
MKRLLAISALIVGALAFAAGGVADPGHGKGKGPHHKLTANGGIVTINNVVTEDHGCSFRVWAIDTLHRKYKVRRNEDGSYSVRREDFGRFVTTGPLSPSADPCPGVIRRGKHGTVLRAGIKGKMHGFIAGTVTGGTFNPNGSCTAVCSNTDFIAGFFTPTTAGTPVRYTCNEGYAGCRFSFKYNVQRHKKQGARFHHWEDRGLNGINETFIGDIANS